MVILPVLGTDLIAIVSVLHLIFNKFAVVDGWSAVDQALAQTFILHHYQPVFFHNISFHGSFNELQIVAAYTTCRFVLINCPFYLFLVRL